MSARGPMTLPITVYVPSPVRPLPRSTDGSAQRLRDRLIEKAYERQCSHDLTDD